MGVYFFFHVVLKYIIEIIKTMKKKTPSPPPLSTAMGTPLQLPPPPSLVHCHGYPSSAPSPTLPCPLPWVPLFSSLPHPPLSTAMGTPLVHCHGYPSSANMDDRGYIFGCGSPSNLVETSLHRLYIVWC